MEQQQQELPLAFPTPADEERKKGKASKEEMKAALPPTTPQVEPDGEVKAPLCGWCGEPILTHVPTLYGGKTYHDECLPFQRASRPVISTSLDLHTNPRLTFSLNLRASEIALLAEIVQPITEMHNVYDRLADVLCEHGNSYARCAWCGKLTLREHAVEGGTHTRKMKEATGVLAGVKSGRFFSRVRSVEVFCGEGCDLNYSKRMKVAWEEEKEKKRKKAEETRERGRGGERKKDSLSKVFKMASKDKRIAAQLQEILDMIAEQSGKEKEGEKDGAQ